MPQARGTQAAFNLYEETAYAQDPGAPNALKIYCKSFNVSSSQNAIESETLTGSRTKSKPVQGNIDVSGDIVMEIAPESIGTLLKHAIGSVNTTGVGPYTHTISTDDLPVGMTLEKDYGTNISSTPIEKFNGDRISSAKFDFPQEGFPTVTFSIKGAKSTMAASPLDATPTDNGHSAFSSFEATIQEGGVTSAKVTKLDFEINNNLDESTFVIGSNTRQELAEGQVMVSGTLTALFDSVDLLNKAVNFTESSLKVILTRGTGLGSAGNESLELSIPALVYDRQSPGIEGPAGVLITLPFKAYGTTTIQAVLKNALTTI